MLVNKKILKEENGDIGYYECVYDSSNILKVTYFPKLKKLYISFNRGGTYSYSNVTPKLFEEFDTAESQGKFFAKTIKSNPKDYPYRKEFTLYPNEINDLKLIVEEQKKGEDE